jgi:hypothetical protein
MTDIIKTDTNPTVILEEIEQAFWDIPFENSAFQTENFVLAGEITPERAYRALGLRMHAKLKTLQAYEIDKELKDIRVEELQYEINQGEFSNFDKRRKELEIKQILSDRPWQEKLRQDIINELNVLYKHFKQLPRYTRQQFEDGERLHFEQRLHRQLQHIDGAAASLINMQEDINALLTYENAYQALPDAEKPLQLEELAQSMKNKIRIMTKEDQV